jgi:glycosyltransferase involved in cell wall biosynthesis
VYKSKRLAVVVPCYNEERQITAVIATMPDFVDHIVVIDDCSPDRTSEVVAAHAASDPRVVLLRHEVNQGVGGAIATGYKWARDHGADLAAVMAGDGQMDPADLPTLLDVTIEHGVNYAKSNRLIWRGSFDVVPRVRFLGNSVLSLLTKIASGYWHIADSQSGYTVADKAVLQTIDWDRMYQRFGQPNDLLVKLNVFNFRVRDVPTRPIYNVGEVSKLKVRKVLWPISMLLLRGFLWRMKEKYIIRDFHPLVFFYALGVLLSLIGTALLVRILALWPTIGYAPELSAIAMMFSYSTGLQCIFFAMWMDMEDNKDLK